MPVPVPVYRPRNPKQTPYYRCVEDHLENLEQVYEDRFERTYGFFRPHVKQVMERYLDCGNLLNGFARIKCEDCGHEYLLAFSCKRRHFCPSCHQKRVVEFGEWLCQNVVKAVPHRHFVFGIPKILRRYFLYDRRLLLELSRCIWESLKIYYQYCMPGKNSVPGGTIAIQTFGDFLGFNPHGHVLVTDGCFPEKGLFIVVPTVRLKYLEKIFISKVLTLLLSKGKITPDHINLLKSWKYSGFQVFCGPRILPRKKEAMENLARYIIRASFSQERMTYLPEESQIIYRSKDKRQEKIFDALDWLAAMCSHIPDQREQMVRYYGFYSNVSRGLRQKENEDALIPCVLEPDENKKPNRNWARLIQKIAACPGHDPGKWTP